MDLMKKVGLKKVILLEITLLIILFSALFVSTDIASAKEVKGSKDGTAVQIQSLMQREVDSLDKKIVAREIKIKEAIEKKERETQLKREELVTYAKQFIGNPYVLGGRSLTNGCDCASYVTLIYRNFGYNWQFGSVSTLLKNCGGREVSVSELKEGDIIFFGNLDHVAIYSGNGMIVHAMDEQHGIRETKLFPSGGTHTYSGKGINTIRRIFE